MTPEFIASQQDPNKQKGDSPLQPVNYPEWKPARNWFSNWKPLFDGTLALILLIVASPIIFLAALLVKLTSRGPAFYCQTRLGVGGKPYTIYKLRTMVHNCEHFSGARWATPGDNRVTPLGNFLRRTRIDELPQFWNVLCGDMSLVGPRPERPEFVPELERVLPQYRNRLLVRPGITGLAQIQLPADTSLHSVRRKLAYDLYYVQHCNFWLDLRILLCTPIYAFFGSSMALIQLLKIPSKGQVEVVGRKAESQVETYPQVQPV